MCPFIPLVYLPLVFMPSVFPFILCSLNPLHLCRIWGAVLLGQHETAGDDFQGDMKRTEVCRGRSLATKLLSNDKGRVADEHAQGCEHPIAG